MMIHNTLLVGTIYNPVTYVNEPFCCIYRLWKHDIFIVLEILLELCQIICLLQYGKYKYVSCETGERMAKYMQKLRQPSVRRTTQFRKFT